MRNRGLEWKRIERISRVDSEGPWSLGVAALRLAIPELRLQEQQHQEQRSQVRQARPHQSLECLS